MRQCLNQALPKFSYKNTFKKMHQFSHLDTFAFSKYFDLIYLKEIRLFNAL